MAKRRWVPIVIGVVILIGFLIIGIIVAISAWFSQNVQFQTTSKAAAQVEFDSVVQRFANKPSMLELDDRVPRFRGGQKPAKPATKTPIEALHVMVWDPDDEQLGRFTIPFWLVRMKEGPIEFGAYASGMDDDGRSFAPANVHVEDLENYGPGIILDFSTPSGERVLLWAQ